jgi:hypothetical protein
VQEGLPLGHGQAKKSKRNVSKESIIKETHVLENLPSPLFAKEE